MSRILKDDLGIAAYKRRTGHFLTDNLKKNRVVKSKQLPKRYAKGGHRKKLFTPSHSLCLGRNATTNTMGNSPILLEHVVTRWR